MEDKDMGMKDKDKGVEDKDKDMCDVKERYDANTLSAPVSCVPIGNIKEQSVPLVGMKAKGKGMKDKDKGMKAKDKGMKDKDKGMKDKDRGMKDKDKDMCDVKEQSCASPQRPQMGCTHMKTQKCSSTL